MVEYLMPKIITIWLSSIIWVISTHLVHKELPFLSYIHQKYCLVAQQEGSGSKNAYHWEWWHEFDAQNPHSRRREPTRF